MTHRTSWAHERILERESFDGGWIKILYRRSRIPSRRQPCPQRERFSKRSPYQFLPHSCAAQFHLARSLEGGTRVSSLLPPGAPIFLSSTSARYPLPLVSQHRTPTPHRQSRLCGEANRIGRPERVEPVLYRERAF